MDTNTASSSDSGSIKDAAENSTDLEQHCLLFPTYATRHSRSGSKDPLDWNIRVRGWAFSKRSNRRKRLVMSMARKLAGLTKDNQVYETLESRFGMFLTNNTQGAMFSIQCVGLAKTSHMELTGAPNSHDGTVNVLKNEMNTSDGVLAAAEAIQDKAQLRKSLEEGQGGYIEDAERNLNINRDRPKDSNGRYEQYQQQSVPQDYSKHSPAPEEQEKSLSKRWAKGATLMKDAYKKYKPIIATQVSGNSHYSGSNNNSNSTLGNLNVPPSNASSRSSTRPNSAASQHSGDESSQPGTLPGAAKAGSGDSIMSQTATHYEDFGHGYFPTIQVSSRPGGHFDGTLRVSHAEVMAHRMHRKKNGTHHGSRGGNGHPRFLKLHAYHPDMREPCQGIVNLVDPEGISIISDIDDTIKETNVAAGARTILRNTFLKDMQDVPGMADVYQRWWKNGAAIHYVSNSPWQLIPTLLDFFHTHKFPPGSAHLRLHDSVLKTYFMTPGEHKRRGIREILMDFPNRKFILIGDSGEIDMEIYTEIAISFPGQIFKIFIRDITTKRLQEMVAKAAATPPPQNRSFTSMLPINAVTAGFGFFSRGDTSSTTGTHSTDNANEKSPSGSAFDESDQPSVDLQPPKLPPRRPKTLTSHSSTPQTTPGETNQGSSHTTVSSTFNRVNITADTHEVPTAEAIVASGETLRQTTTDVAALDDEPMPGAPPPNEPQPIKNPLEVWMDRVEVCRSKLPEGTLIFFEDSSTLEEDPLVSGMIQSYRAASTWDDDDSDGDDDGGDDEIKHAHEEKLVDVGGSL